MTRETVVRSLLDARQELLEAVHAVPEESWSRTPPDGGWSVDLVLEHLLRVEVGITRRARAIFEQAAPPAARAEDLPIDMSKTRGLVARSTRVESPERSRPEGAMPGRVVLERLAHSRADALALLDELAGHDVGALTMPHFVFGELNLMEWVYFIGGHELRHVAQIQEIGASLAR